MTGNAFDPPANAKKGIWCLWISIVIFRNKTPIKVLITLRLMGWHLFRTPDMVEPRLHHLMENKNEHQGGTRFYFFYCMRS